MGGWAMEADHRTRYLACLEWCEGKRVLDAACGSGYGTALLAQKARQAVGTDVAPEAVAYAEGNHSTVNSTFVVGSVTALPFSNGSFDAVVSFETLEHLDEDAQEQFIDEIRRVLSPNGVLYISTPDAKVTEQRGVVNKFHIHERSRTSFEALLQSRYSNVSVYYQNLWVYSEVAPVDRPAAVSMVPPSRGQNLIAVCSDGALPDISFRQCTQHDYVEMSRLISEVQQGYEGSVSWRITAPLRGARNLLRQAQTLTRARP
jgi:ubiquinone/menaquinone biosynthesis C-methylase UbiE